VSGNPICSGFFPPLGRSADWLIDPIIGCGASDQSNNCHAASTTSASLRNLWITSLIYELNGAAPHDQETLAISVTESTGCEPREEGRFR
jgi:hypothetical protein